ncbi:MAG: hypothetical protein P1U90_17010 [Akkermansiaceae bacterium]|nr:hypothetical protein [Akkermansiaceae bacterium]
MKKLLKLTAGILVGVMGASCTTSFDSYGNRRQAIDPAGAAIGAVALGALAYSIGKNNGERREHRRHTSGRRYYNNGWEHNVHHGGRYCR